MASNMNKALAVIAGIIALVAIIPIDLLAWWRWDVTVLGNSWPNWFDAYNQFHIKLTYISDYSISQFDNMYLYAGIAVIAGGVLMLLGGISGAKFIAMLGALAAIAGPIIFLVAQNGNADIKLFIGDNVFFGSASGLGYSWNWYLGAGFFLPMAGAILGFVSLKSNK
jgi:hypothetical protein